MNLTVRIFTILSVAALFVALHFTATTPRPAHAQSDVKATVSPLPTAIPVDGQWLFLRGGSSMQGECIGQGYKPNFFEDGTQWKVICLYGGSQ